MTSPESPATVSLSDPGDLIAATPVLLGFVPRSSLVAMSLGGASGRRLGLTLRIDLPPPEHIAGAAEAVVEGMLRDRPSAVVLVVVGPGGAAGPPAAEMVERVVACLASHAIDACHALWTESTTAGSRWRCYDECGCTGIVPRSSASPLAAAAYAEGRVVRADRTELEQLVAPVDEGLLRRREALLDAAIDAEANALFAGISAEADSSCAGIIGAATAGMRSSTAKAGGPHPGAEMIEDFAALDAALDAADAVVTAAADGAPGEAGADNWLDDEQVVALTRALRVPAVHEAAVGACTGPRAAAAEVLWAALTRGTPDPEAAEPAALLALMGLLHGDGALANVALQRAEAAWPGHRFTATLRGLAAIGIRPSELRSCLTGQHVPGRAPQRPMGRGRARGGASRSARRRRRRR